MNNPIKINFFKPQYGHRNVPESLHENLDLNPDNKDEEIKKILSLIQHTLIIFKYVILILPKNYLINYENIRQK